MEHEDPLQPLKEFHAGPIRATVWRNTYNDPDGRTEEYHTVHVRRSYQTDEGGHGDSPYFGSDDLPQLAAVVQAAYAWLAVNDDTSQDHPQVAARTATPVLVGYAELQGQ